MLRADLLKPSGFAEAVAMAFGKVLTGAMDEHVQAAISAGRDPRVRDEVWSRVATTLHMSRSTLSKTIHGERLPTLVEIERLLAHPRVGQMFREHLQRALAVE